MFLSRLKKAFFHKREILKKNTTLLRIKYFEMKHLVLKTIHSFKLRHFNINSTSLVGGLT